MVMAIPRRHAVFTHIRLATDVRSTVRQRNLRRVIRC
jgi:hypothetical protein